MKHWCLKKHHVQFRHSKPFEDRDSSIVDQPSHSLVQGVMLNFGWNCQQLLWQWAQLQELLGHMAFRLFIADVWWAHLYGYGDDWQLHQMSSLCGWSELLFQHICVARVQNNAIKAVHHHNSCVVKRDGYFFKNRHLSWTILSINFHFGLINVLQAVKFPCQRSK